MRSYSLRANKVWRIDTFCIFFLNCECVFRSSPRKFEGRQTRTISGENVVLETLADIRTVSGARVSNDSESGQNLQLFVLLVAVSAEPLEL